MTIEEDVAEFLFASGLLGGALFGKPTDPANEGPCPVFGNVALVSRPWYAWIFRNQRNRLHERFVAGVVAIGRQKAFYWPDALLGFVGPRGEWIWPTGEPGVILGPRAIHRAIAPDVGWPVWFTCAHYEDHRAMERRGSMDVFETRRRAQLRAFWDASLQEFVAKTWHPSRLMWCLDHEEIFLLDTS